MLKTEILPISTGISRATELLHAGELVAFPTETVYGLGADAKNDLAVAKIFEAKSRPQFNPLIVHVANIEAVEAIAIIPDAARKLITLWPGPLTLVLPRRAESGLSELVTAGLVSVAVRIPANAVAHALLSAFGGPIAAPSANPSGKISPTTKDHVEEGLTGRIAAILDGGPCEVGLESTIVGVTPDPTLLRAGGIPAEEIEALIEQKLETVCDAQITAPGQLKSHYAPDAHLRLNVLAPENEIYLSFGPDISKNAGLNLSPDGDLREAAANLFAYLRNLDKLAAQSGQNIAVAPIPMTGLGVAINDRLDRAAAPRN